MPSIHSVISTIINIPAQHLNFFYATGTNNLLTRPFINIIVLSWTVMHWSGVSLDSSTLWHLSKKGLLNLLESDTDYVGYMETLFLVLPRSIIPQCQTDRCVRSVIRKIDFTLIVWDWNWNYLDPHLKHHSLEDRNISGTKSKKFTCSSCIQPQTAQEQKAVFSRFQLTTLFSSIVEVNFS